MAALTEADRLVRSTGDRELQFDVNRKLGDLALEDGAFPLAHLAYAVCASLRPEGNLRALARDRERAESRRRKARILTILDDLRVGRGRKDRPPGFPLLTSSSA